MFFLPVFVYFSSSCSHVTEARRTVRFVRLVLNVFVQNNRDFIDKIMLHLSTRENVISLQKTVNSIQFLCFRWCIGGWLTKEIF
jgi:hypothetical protein